MYSLSESQCIAKLMDNSIRFSRATHWSTLSRDRRDFLPQWRELFYKRQSESCELRRTRSLSLDVLELEILQLCVSISSTTGSIEKNVFRLLDIYIYHVNKWKDREKEWKRKKKKLLFQFKVWMRSICWGAWDWCWKLRWTMSTRMAHDLWLFSVSSAEEFIAPGALRQ